MLHLSLKFLENRWSLQLACKFYKPDGPNERKHISESRAVIRMPSHLLLHSPRILDIPSTALWCYESLKGGAPSSPPSLYYPSHEVVKALQALLQTWNFTQKPNGSCADCRALHKIQLKEEAAADCKGSLSCSFPRNCSMETKDHTLSMIPIPWVLATGSCVQDVPAASQIIHTLLRRKEAEFLSCRCPGKHIHCLYLTHWTHTRSWHISSWKSQIFLLRFASRNSSWSLHKSSLKSPSACCSYPVTGKSPACTNVGALTRAMEQVRSKHRGHQHSTLICKDSWIKHVPQIRTSSAQSNDKTYDQLIKWTFISSSCGLSGCETYKMTCSGAVPQVQQWWDRRKKKRMNFSSLNVNLSLLQNIKHLLQIYFPNAALRRKVTSSLTQWVLRFLCWVMSPWLLFYRTGMSVQVPQLWGHHILHKDIKYQPSSISFLVLW